MYPDIFPMVAAYAPATAVLGDDPVRFWPFGIAREHETRPYAVHQLAYGAPENTLSCAPDIDNFAVQVDCYARTVTEARTVATAIRDALETDAYLTAYNGEGWEQDTGLYRIILTFEFWTPR